MLLRLGPNARLSTDITFPIFSQILLILVNLHLFLPQLFSFSTIYSSFWSFYASGYFIDPRFLLFLPFELLVVNGSLAKIFLLPLLLGS